MNFERLFPVGASFQHCGRACVVMRYLPELSDASPPMMLFEYSDAAGIVRPGKVIEIEYPAIEAQNLP